MGEVKLDKALSAISSERQKDRSEGLEDLKHILLLNRRTTKLNTLDDKGCHKICEALFRLVTVEKSLYNRPNKPTSKAQATARLGKCALALRITVEVGAPRIRNKTVTALFDHITDTLPVPGEGLWELLARDYLRTLRILLSCAPHLEHLSNDDWRYLVEFCLRGIGIAEDEQGSQLSFRSASRLPSEGLDEPGTRAHSIEPSSRSRGRNAHANSTSISEELEMCLQLLCSSSSAPVHDEAQKLITGITNYLSALNRFSRSPHGAFGALNAVLPKVMKDDIALAQDAMLDIIPIIRRFWTTKSATLKEEMLITLMLGRSILQKLSKPEPRNCLTDLLQILVDQLHREYIGQSEKEILHLDDLTFPFQPTPFSMGIRVIAPRLGVPRSEQNWVTLWTIANFSKILDGIRQRDIQSPIDEGVRSKKQQLLSRARDIFREASSAPTATRICALQLVPFLLLEDEPETEFLSSLLEQLSAGILDENVLVASWTMVAIASLGSAAGAATGEMHTLWLQVWELASRNLSVQATSRAACGLMTTILRFKLLEYADVADTLDAILSSVDLNGPSNLTDSALSFWATVAEIRTKFNPTQAQDMSKQICAWLRSTWTLGTLTDRIQALQIATHARPTGLLSVLMNCTGRQFVDPASPPSVPLGRLSRSWLSYCEDSELVEYLLLTNQPKEADLALSGSNEMGSAAAPRRHSPNDQLILELLQTKVDSFSQGWLPLFNEKPQHVTADLIQVLVSVCVVSYAFVHSVPSPPSQRCQSLQQSTDKLWSRLCDFFEKQDVEFLHACLDIVSPLVLSLSPPFVMNDIILKAMRRLALRLAPILERHRDKERYAPEPDPDDMDLDDDFMTEDSRSIAPDPMSMFDREDIAIPVFGDYSAIRIATTVQLSVLHHLNDTCDDFHFPDGRSLVDHLTSLDEVDIVICRQFIKDLFMTRTTVTRDDACQLLEHIGEMCLQSYELERCEAALCACLDVMIAFVEFWTNDERDNLSESAADLYKWFTNVIIGKGLGSARVWIRVSTLLSGVLKANPAYSPENSHPSPRTTLFKIMDEGNLTVKFHASKTIPAMFGRFVLKEHDAIFDDVIDNLPRDPDWTEGLALRLYVLSQLASKWHTLLRRSIYHIFETPGKVPQSAPYAKTCLREVSKYLGLSDARHIFRLFASQILYTWMEEQPLVSIPFSIFGYSSLEELLEDVHDEIQAQIVLRGRGREMAEVSDRLGLPFEDMLAIGFYKAEAYSIARDISIPPSQDSQPKGAENRIKKLLGTEKFNELVEIHFAETLATLLKSADQMEQIQKAFLKRPNFQYALDIWTDIDARSNSKAILPAAQQPSFRAKYLLDEFEFLCKRTGYDLDTIWTPTLISFLARRLIDTIHPALGSLHACSVLRKLRIVICLAGEIALQDYTLEMLLHALRPFLTDFHCSEDAIGLFWYLVENGRRYLVEKPSFMAGLAVSTLASLRGLLSSSQESTTQEIHFRETMSKAQAFHDWFSGFLDKYASPNLSNDNEISFRNIVKSSQNIQTGGSASRDSYGAGLIINILQDQAKGGNMLTGPAAELAFSLLCDDFQGSQDFRDDILGEDSVATHHAVAIWDSVQNGPRGTGYRLWAARALGRAYAATGTISESLLREQRSTLFKNIQEGSSAASKVSIIQILCDSLLSNNRRDVGLSEHTLQIIVDGLTDSSESEECENAIPIPLMKTLRWSPYQCPDLTLSRAEQSRQPRVVRWLPNATAAEWAQDITLSLTLGVQDELVIGALPKILHAIPTLAMQLLPYILHDVLLSEIDGGQPTRQAVSNVFRQAFHDIRASTYAHIGLIIDCILYLRHQELPYETTMKERDDWLEVDYMEAATAASRCQLYKTSLLFLEIHSSRIVMSSRRSSAIKTQEPPDLLHDIFKNIGDLDLFYGIRQDASLESVLSRLEHESSGFKNLSFQSANYDVDVKLSQAREKSSAVEILKALNSTNLQGIASALFTAPGGSAKRPDVFESMLSTAMDLHQWDIPAPSNPSSATGNVFKVLQSLNTFDDKTQLVRILDDGFLGVLNHLLEENQPLGSVRALMRTLGILCEVDEALSSQSWDQIQEVWQRILSRNAWLKFESFEDISQILSSHEALFSIINRKPYLKSILNLGPRDAQLLEASVIRESLRTSREHDVHQVALKLAIYLSKLVEPCTQLGLHVSAAATLDLANVLWDQGEMTTSIQMLQQLSEQTDLPKQSIPVSRAEVLASLGHHVAEARLQKPDAIIQNYLVPATKDLNGRVDGAEAGRVFHEFATFCDQQLQNADDLEEFKRIEKIRGRKQKEVMDLEQMMKSAEGREKEQLRIHRTKAKQWFELDDREYQRLKQSREAFLQQCLEMYLLSLKACDTFGNDVLRFCALWLDNSENDKANQSVSKNLAKVPSRKFASLMNQLSSRLLDVEDSFQPLLSELVFRICVEHPYHGMYQLFTTSKSKGGKDQTAIARYNAAGRIVEQLRSHRTASTTWVAVHNTNISFVRFAMDRLDEKLKSGSKVLLRKSITGQRLEQDVARQEIPPPTIKLDLRINCDYSDVPRLMKYLPEFTVASGVSAPKIVTAIATDGLRYKQLFKGGNDDLRQDAIMEQVFEQVSNLLKDHRATQQRKLGIRTYKVLPLTANAGIIEFVQNTIPLHDYLMPAHQKHFPRDMKASVCRKHINDAQTKSVDQRAKIFRQVIEHFHPVMRFFFMERFKNPDDWFSKRLAYTRSTAAISMLGHVLGLGDRHGHNILLDEKTGEVVHIDLGVAFEQGRVLPVPEVVPFRLTRDLVDGMGTTKTEGVFRRCCEFTLEALRQESYSIMTILDVLRYDPLYSWSLSPLRAKKMQDTQEGAAGGASLGKNDNEPSEADRALTVVARKLGKTLSVAATVNELIQQATDVRNLAVLYCGRSIFLGVQHVTCKQMNPADVTLYS
ncbi:hypothetical protein AJ80_06930 [Polytolypa hystricis UAMH7299]|uniref:Serine/threonine-protein kinase Tel1 n=1 Tax=Polytolypa hystricis (strain UAMH7299) TaxID=1447883 RepID=A0A2B7XSD3_POLH7|nr:hypothetical protein AJ80_06930 [Polytolypa hystricis UAMH7299]